MKKVLFLAILPVFLIFLPVNAQVVENPASFLTINLSGSAANSSDFPYGIDCSDNTFAYATIYESGILAEINKSTRAVTLFDNNAVASGEDWYSVVRDPVTGKVFINERDTGRTRVFNPSTDTFTTIAIPQNIAGGVVSYTSSHANAPHDITISGSGTHLFGFDSFGELKATNGYVWQVIDYVYDFTAGEEAAGATDVSFHGIARIDPNTLTVTRYAISGASALRGITVDAADSTILWITDNVANKLYKFNTSTTSVTQTIDLPAGTNARGLADDGANLYIAMNQNGVGTSKILKVVKSNSAMTELDTGVAKSGFGTFTVFFAANKIIWTDQSGHYGLFDINDFQGTKTSASTTGNTNSNHFGCQVGSEFWFAGKGSAKIGSFSLSNSAGSSRGDSCMGDCYSPHLGNDENNRYFYDDGLTINGVKYEIKNQLHNHADKILEFPVGIPLNMTLKVQDSYPDNVKSCEIAFGIPRGHFIKQDASFILGTSRTFDGVVSTYTEGDKSAFRDYTSSMENIGDTVIVKTIVTPTKHIKHDMFALECKDIHGYYTTYFVNDGILFRGISEVGTPVFDYIDNSGRNHVLTLVDQTLEDQTLAIDESGNYWKGDFGKFWNKEFVRPDMRGSFSAYHGFDRLDPEFKMIKLGQELIAVELFDSSQIQKTVKPSYAHEFVSYGRLHDPVPNMMKAQADLAIKNFNRN